MTIVALPVFFASVVFLSDKVANLSNGDRQEVRTMASCPRGQIADLPTNWVDQLPEHFDAADSFLALFAQPGRTEYEAFVALDSPLTEETLTREAPPPVDGDSEWVVKLKMILATMKEESAALIKNGKTPSEIVVWLRERQRMEVAYRQQILDGEGNEEEKRQRLTAIGL